MTKKGLKEEIIAGEEKDLEINCTVLNVRETLGDC